MTRSTKLMNVFTLAIACSTPSLAVAAPGKDSSAVSTAVPTTTSKIKQRASLLAGFSGAGFLDSELGQAVQAGNRKTTEKLLKEGAKAEVKGHWGHSLLHIVAANSSENPERSLKIAQLLLQAGADIKAASKSGVTPLHEAILSGSTKMAEFLIANGATVDAPLRASGHCLDPDHDLVHSAMFGPSKEHRTPLYFARALKRDGFVKLIEKAVKKS